MHLVSAIEKVGAVGSPLVFWVFTLVHSAPVSRGPTQAVDFAQLASHEQFGVCTTFEEYRKIYELFLATMCSECELRTVSLFLTVTFCVCL